MLKGGRDERRRDGRWNEFESRLKSSYDVSSPTSIVIYESKKGVGLMQGYCNTDSRLDIRSNHKRRSC